MTLIEDLKRLKELKTVSPEGEIGTGSPPVEPFLPGAPGDLIHPDAVTELTPNQPRTPDTLTDEQLNQRIRTLNFIIQNRQEQEKAGIKSRRGEGDWIEPLVKERQELMGEFNRRVQKNIMLKDAPQKAL